MIKINNELRDKCRNIGCDLGWDEQFYLMNSSPMLVIIELSYAAKLYMYDRRADMQHLYDLNINTYNFGLKYDAVLLDTVEEKLADAIIKCLYLAVNWSVNVDDNTCSGMPDGMLIYSGLDFSTFLEETINEFLDKDKCPSQDVEDLIKSILSYSALNDIDILWCLEQRINYNELLAKDLNKKHK